MLSKQSVKIPSCSCLRDKCIKLKVELWAIVSRSTKAGVGVELKRGDAYKQDIYLDYNFCPECGKPLTDKNEEK